MLSVAIHKDVSEYQPKIIGKLTLRTLICICGAIGISVLTALYMTFVLGVQVSDYFIVVEAISVPFWLCGFIRPNGMKFEVFARYWIEYNFTSKRLLYTPAFILAGVDEGTISAHKKERKAIYDKELRKLYAEPGFECYSAKAGRIS